MKKLILAATIALVATSADARKVNGEVVDYDGYKVVVDIGFPFRKEPIEIQDATNIANEWCKKHFNRKAKHMLLYRDKVRVKNRHTLECVK